MKSRVCWRTCACEPMETPGSVGREREREIEGVRKLYGHKTTKFKRLVEARAEGIHMRFVSHALHLSKLFSEAEACMIIISKASRGQQIMMFVRR